MDKAAQMAMTWNLDAIKEPRGFIKIIEVVIAIFAFATTTSVHTNSKFEMKYDNCTEQNTNISYHYGYPFNMNGATFKYQESCGAVEKTQHPFGDYSSAAQFYVFVGVMAFLYSVAAIILYVCFDEVYRRIDKIPMADFVVTAVFVALWLISAAAWADGVSKVKQYTNPYDMFYDELKVCDPLNVDNGITCRVIHSGNFASLNVSIIFGFLNMCVWGGNLWFLFKETSWHKVTTEHPDTSPSETPQKV